MVGLLEIQVLEKATSKARDSYYTIKFYHKSRPSPSSLQQESQFHSVSLSNQTAGNELQEWRHSTAKCYNSIHVVGGVRFVSCFVIVVCTRDNTVRPREGWRWPAACSFGWTSCKIFVEDDSHQPWTVWGLWWQRRTEEEETTTFIVFLRTSQTCHWKWLLLAKTSLLW